MDMCNEWDLDIDLLQYQPTWSLDEGLKILAYFMCRSEDVSEAKFPVKFNYWYDKYYILAQADFRMSLPLKNEHVLTSPEGVQLPHWEFCSVEPADFLRWSEAIGSEVPEAFRDKVVHARDKRRELVYDEQEIIADDNVSYSDVTATDRRLLGQLKREKEKWEESIQAAVDTAVYCATNKKIGAITRLMVGDFLHSKRYNLPTTTIEKIWKSLPVSYKSKGGRPRKTD